MLEEINGAPRKSGAFDSWLKMQKEPSEAFFLAQAYAGLGRKDQAFASLEKAYQVPTRSAARFFRSSAITDNAVIRPVLGFSEGMFSICRQTSRSAGSSLHRGPR